MSPPPIRRASRAPGGRLTARARRGSRRAAPGTPRRRDRRPPRSRHPGRSTGRARQDPRPRRSPDRTPAAGGPSPPSPGTGQRPQVAQVGAVHREDQVELLEVLRADLARRAAQLDAAPRGSGRRPAIRRAADVPGARPGRVEHDPVLHPGLAHDVSHHTLGGRRAADVPQADEQEPNRGAPGSPGRPESSGNPYSSPNSRTARKASCGTSTRPTCFIRFLPSFCLASSFFLRVMSPP